MKLFLILIISLFIISCSNNKSVYWCGDHACVNKKEKEAYFKKFMIIEKKEINKKFKKKESVTEKILNQAKVKNKKILKNENKIENEIANELKKENKLRIKREKEIAKKLKKENKLRIKREKEIAKKLKKENKKIIKLAKKKKVVKNKNLPLNENNNLLNVVSNDFLKLKKNITERNINKPYPSINDIPK